MTLNRNGLIRFLVLFFPVVLIGCSSPSRQAAVPTALADRAMVLNNPGVRTWDDTMNPAFLEEMFSASKHEFDLRREAGETGPLPPAHFLAISGGGAERRVWRRRALRLDRDGHPSRV